MKCGIIIGARSFENEKTTSLMDELLVDVVRQMTLKKLWETTQFTQKLFI